MKYEFLNDQLDKLLALALVIIFVVGLGVAVHWDNSNARLVDVLEGGLQYALGLFSALTVPGGLSSVKRWLGTQNAQTPNK